MKELIISEIKQIDEIKFNFEELKEQAENAVKSYGKETYTLETIKVAKEDRATLNKLKTAIEDKRKEIKKQINEPYEVFAIKVKELVEIIDKPILLIDSQIKNFEETAKNEKLEQILSVFEIIAKPLGKLINSNNVFNEKWLNATYKIKDIEQEISDYVVSIQTGIATIKELGTEFEQEAIAELISTNNLSSAISKAASLKSQKENLLKLQQEKVAELPKEEVKEEPKEVVKETVAIFTVTLQLTATRDELIKVRNYLEANNIKFERTDKE